MTAVCDITCIIRRWQIFDLPKPDDSVIVVSFVGDYVSRNLQSEAAISNRGIVDIF
jgi:hypothetical protein